MRSIRDEKNKSQSTSTTMRLSNDLAVKTTLFVDKIEIIDDYAANQVSKESNPKENNLLADAECFVMIPPTAIPLKQRPESHYEKISGNLSHSFHHIFKMIKKNRKIDSKPPTVHFFKQNKDNPHDPYMYTLEATICGFYQLLAPHHSPSARALYDGQLNNVGIISKELQGFKPISEEPLKEEDFLIDALKYISIEELESIDERARREGLQLENKPNNQIIYQVFLSPNNNLGSTEDKPAIKIPVTARDLKNFRTIKGQAIGLTTSYIFEEDDLHTFNVSETGVRIDFDMSLWPITYHFKKGGAFDWALRDPTGRFDVTANDILHFPNLKDAAPFYWPALAANVLNVSKNAFSSRANAIHQKLESHPVFIHYKFVTLIKYILTSEDIYRNISRLHIHEESKFENKNFIDILAKHEADRLALFKTELLKLTNFHEFLATHGDKILKNILMEFSEYNTKFAKKIGQNSLYQPQIINLNQVIKEYVDICAKIRIVKNPDIIKEDPDIANMLTENFKSMKKPMS